MNAFEQGFIEKCAEYGVDPSELMKAAQLYSPSMPRYNGILGGGSSRFVTSSGPRSGQRAKTINGGRGWDVERMTNKHREQAARFGLNNKEYLSEFDKEHAKAVADYDRKHGKLGTGLGRAFHRLFGGYEDYLEGEERKRSQVIGERIQRKLQHNQNMYNLEHGITDNGAEYLDRYGEQNRWKAPNLSFDRGTIGNWNSGQYKNRTLYHEQSDYANRNGLRYNRYFNG